MKKSRLLIVVITCLVLALAALPFVGGCAKPGTTPERISMASYPVVWGSYAISVGMANVVNKYSSLELVVESMPGGDAMIEAVATGATALSMGESIFNLSWAYTGTEKYADQTWAPAQNLRALVAGELWSFAFMTGPNTGVKTFADLKGKTIPTFAWLSTVPQYFAIIEAHGIDLEKDITVILVSHSGEGWEEVQMGRAVLVYDIPNVELLEQQEKLGELVFLPVDTAAFEAAKAKYPLAFAGVSLGKLMPGEVPGLKMSGAGDLQLYESVLFGNTELSENAAYAIVTALVDNYQEVQSIAFGVSTFSPETAAPVISTFPYHPGAIKAYKDLGLWTKEHEESQKAFK